MVTIDPSEEAPEGLTGEEFVEWMKKHKKKPVPTETAASEEEVETIAKPAIRGKRVGQMQASKGGKPAGEVTEYGGNEEEGIDASKETFMGRHQKLAKAVGVGKKIVGVVNEKTAGYVKDTEGIDRKLKELERNKDEEEEEKPSKKKSSKKKSKDEDFDFDDEDEDITALHKATSKQKVLPGDYKSAYGGGMGKKGYESVYTSSMGGGTYQPAYKPKVRENIELATPSRVKSAVEEMPTTPQPAQRTPDRFNLQNWQSMGFPNTLPMSARGNLFRPAPPRPAPQPVVTPMVRQPYQPQPMPQPVRSPARVPMSGPMPRIGLSMNVPQLMKPRPINIPRAPSSPAHTTVPKTAQMSFMGVTFGEKKKQEPKPLTRMGEGYKNVPLVVMNGLYPNAGYNPNKDPITKKSIIPKIRADITPNNFTMFGMKLKNRKI